MRITCDIIRDLLPLYIDDVLSNDSKTLVEEHINSCPDCKKTREALKEYLEISSSKQSGTEKSENEAWPLRKIKRNIKQKNIKISIIVSVLAIVVAFLGFEIGTKYEAFYVPYEKSGIVMTEDGKMYVYEDYFRRHIKLYTDTGIAFVHLTDSLFTVNRGVNEDEKLEVKYDFLNPPEQSFTKNEVGEVSKDVRFYKEVYYINKENLEKLENEYSMSGAEEEKLIEEIKNSSVLLWKRR